LNRINVFVVSYTPPYVIKSYFPSVGEVAISVGFVAALMFLYRVFVFVFPVLGERPRKMSTAVLLLLGISALLWGRTQALASENSSIPKSIMSVTRQEFPSIAEAPKVWVLNNQIINSYSDLYESVRFMHSKHANVLKDCTICHHRLPKNDSDKIGEPVSLEKLKEMKKMPVGCSGCHNRPFNREHPEIPGLKGAYHRLCIECHREAEQVPHVRGPVVYSAMVRGPIARTLDTRAPTDCLSCHAKKVPDHSKLVQLQGTTVDAVTVTKTCLSCHETEGKAILKTSHWKWQGPSPYTVGYEKHIDLGKSSKTINNFCINLNGNWPRCTSCHIGYGWKEKHFDFSDMSKIDCLVCHDTTGTYKKAPPGAGFPKKDVDLVQAQSGYLRQQLSLQGWGR